MGESAPETPLPPTWLQPLTPHLHYRIYYGDGNAQNKRAVGLGLSEGIQSQFNMMHQGEKHDRLAGRRWFLMFDGKWKCVDVLLEGFSYARIRFY